MCSIYGTIGKNYKQIAPMFSKYLHHRGPNDNGIYYDDNKNLALGHNRLSIIDLSNNAHQPMIDENNYVLVFNGEIYNYKEIKKELQTLGYSFKTNSDTEVVLKSFIAWKEKCLEKFRGMFAFCIYDKKKKKLFLARDRFGIKPLIYGFINNQFIFSSELKPILKSNFFSKKLNFEAVNDYFKYGSIKQPKTILENFYFLMPSYYMEVNIETFEYKIKRYYDLIKKSFLLPKIKNYEEAVRINRQYLEEATKYHLIADVEVGAFLSGGVDSTAVVALMQQYLNKPINTFSVGFKEKIEIEDETEIATRSAKFIGCNHHNIKIDDNYILNIIDDFIDSIDQPSIDGINTYIVSRETSKTLKVALSGLGGDEIYAGYPHFKNIIENSNKKHNLFIFLAKELNKIRPNRFTNKYSFYGLNEIEAVEYQRTINKNLSYILKQPQQSIFKYQSLSNLSPIQKISKCEIDNYLLNTLLRDSDVVSMANSLEVRPVLLDHKLVEFVFSLDDNFKIRNGILKSIFIDSVKDIIPQEVYKRKKTGFEMPFSKWLNGILNNKFKVLIENEKAKYIFQKRYLNNLKYRIQHLKLKRNDWIAFVFLSWLDKYKVNL